MPYEHQKIEAKWQKFWEEHKSNQVKEDAQIPRENRVYILDMFPYPSGAGLHVGHPEGYTATDIYARYLRMQGQAVLHPMGFDAFGLPAENYAIKAGVHPRESTRTNIATFRRQIKSIGFSYDWSREISTCEPEYYKWTQWFFLLMYKNGLAYRKLAPVNWCPSCQTVLAREQVVNGNCERCGTGVTAKELEQWFFKITAYADRLLEGLNRIDWPLPIKTMQENWIGRSEGALIKFKIKSDQNKEEYLEVFTTRPDTIFGATYMVISPEHPLIQTAAHSITNLKDVQAYLAQATKKSELERTDLAKVKTGIVLDGISAINPATGAAIPIWVADYVLMSYGTGAIMAVPAHDERDFEFAKKYQLPVKFVIYPELKADDLFLKRTQEEPYVDVGILQNSDRFNGLASNKAKSLIIESLKKDGLAQSSVQYKLRDWLISRQRYWGAPIPIIYCEKCGEVPVPVEDLPVLLPDDVDFRPTGESPLRRSKSFHQVKCPTCGSPARRESDTMDTFVCSSWYHFRYTDPANNQAFAAGDKIKYWLPVDIYVGGAEHAVLHLLYARFFCKVLYDQKLIDFDEPFKKLINQGLIMAEDGRKMSKSLGNVINPDQVVAEFGADTLRMYEMFMGPLEDSKPWSTQGIRGLRRFLEKVWAIGLRAVELQRTPAVKQSPEFERLLHQTIKKVTEDIENFKFNTAVSQLMILANSFSASSAWGKGDFRLFLQLLAPFAPHLAEELWEMLGEGESIFKAGWPQFDVSFLKADNVVLVVQINGKVRDKITLPADSSKEDILKQVHASPKIAKWIAGQTIKQEIIIGNRLVSLVI